MCFDPSVWWVFCVCLFPPRQSPVAVPHRIRSTSRSAREGKTLSEINCEFLPNVNSFSVWFFRPENSFCVSLFPLSSHLSPSPTFSLSVGQVKFDPPLRKETEPHHEPVSYELCWVLVCVRVCVFDCHFTRTGMSDPHLFHSRHSNQSLLLSVCVAAHLGWNWGILVKATEASTTLILKFHSSNEEDLEKRKGRSNSFSISVVSFQNVNSCMRPRVALVEVCKCREKDPYDITSYKLLTSTFYWNKSWFWKCGMGRCGVQSQSQGFVQVSPPLSHIHMLIHAFVILSFTVLSFSLSPFVFIFPSGQPVKSTLK